MELCNNLFPVITCLCVCFSDILRFRSFKRHCFRIVLDTYIACHCVELVLDPKRTRKKVTDLLVDVESIVRIVKVRTCFQRAGLKACFR